MLSLSVLYHQPIGPYVARDIARLVQDNGFHTNFYINDVLHTTHFNPESEYYAKITGVTPIHSPCRRPSWMRPRLKS
ncbi:MAG: hypothetical protein R2857_04460 [Vampirovibrionales bacterium]